MTNNKYGMSYRDAEIVATNLMNKFIEIRKESNVKVVKSEPVVLAEAADLSGIGSNASDVSEMLTLQRIKDKNDSMDDMLEKYLPYLAVIAVGMGMPIIAYMIISSVK